eukprot:TRINITY_DN789_c0_g1_i1.p1 TRINITY_DN789_c0_g1~~TRINITY_DN789_c0_g1_i1.p1  ORF type:complete len:219 (-),score=42.90 TRINITY_DN789_c0_g1_i1:169-825(-)
MGNSSTFYIYSVDLDTGAATRGAEFVVKGNVDCETVLCDSSWHTVLLLLQEGNMTVTVLSVVPATGAITITASFTSNTFPISLMADGQVYDFSNFERQRILKREYYFATIVINMATKATSYIPYENDGVTFGDPAVFSKTSSGVMLGLVVNMSDTSFQSLTQRTGDARVSRLSSYEDQLCFFTTRPALSLDSATMKTMFWTRLLWDRWWTSQQDASIC